MPVRTNISVLDAFRAVFDGLGRLAKAGFVILLLGDDIYFAVILHYPSFVRIFV